MSKAIKPTPVPEDQLPSFRRCLNYIRRVGGKEVNRPDAALWAHLLEHGYSALRAGQALSDFVLTGWSLLPYENGHRAVVTLHVCRDLPPFHSTQRYVIGSTIAAVEAKLPKPPPKARQQKPVAPVAGGRKVFSAEG